MNKRIKELLNQSTKEIWGNNSYNGSPEFEGYEVDHEKFAELLVRECAKIAKVDSDFYARYIGDATMSAKADVLALCSHHIKDHFGVE